jgi:hypothetical protein
MDGLMDGECSDCIRGIWCIKVEVLFSLGITVISIYYK